MAHRRAPEADLDLDDIWHYVATKSGSADIADHGVDLITGPRSRRRFAPRLAK